MKFEIKDLKEGGYCLFEKSDDWEYLITLGNIKLRKENHNCYSSEIDYGKKQKNMSNKRHISINLNYFH